MFNFIAFFDRSVIEAATISAEAQLCRLSCVGDRGWDVAVQSSGTNEIRVKGNQILMRFVGTDICAVLRSDSVTGRALFTRNQLNLGSDECS